MCWNAVAIINLWRYYYDVSHAKIYHTPSTVIVFGLLLLFSLPPLLKHLFFFCLRFPVFIANESFVFDYYEGIKYYWDDIDYVEYTENEQLEVRIKNPSNYSWKIKNLGWAMMSFFRFVFLKKLPVFYVNLDLLNIKKGENGLFLERLNELSISGTIITSSG